MKLIHALEVINQRRPPDAQSKTVFLACGFAPMHLRTFLHAHLLQLFPVGNVKISSGLYGDLIGNVERASSEAPDYVGLILEWPDLDPRLGFRQLGGWSPELFPDILASSRLSLERLEAVLKPLTAGCPIALSLPTLPLPPLELPAGWQAGMLELELREAVAQFAVRASRLSRLRVLNPERLDVLSPVARRFDAKSELTSGFPYQLAHADLLADLVASLLRDAPPKKGLITDLDDTCWKGILGEVGVDNICWDLTGHAQVHGIYQQFLHALSRRGVLIAVTSKNDPALVEQAFQRNDIHLPAESVFPMEINWRPKSESVSRILKTWNIDAEAVVFVDDSPMELAEVRAAFPEMECLEFPKSDPDRVLNLLHRLQDLFGKPTVLEEDRLRGHSIRGAQSLRGAAAGDSASYEKFLNQCNSTIYFHVAKNGNNARAFELVNKTNQFNLNGRRYSESEWQAYFRQQGAFLLTASYQDKFGPLGEIAVIIGRDLSNGVLCIDAWVMSCRAFSRRIEHQCLQYLFRKFEADEITFDWLETPRNGPLCEFLASFGTLQKGLRLSRSRFETACPNLFHTVAVEEERLSG